MGKFGFPAAEPLSRSVVRVHPVLRRNAFSASTDGAARCLGASRLQAFAFVVIPTTLPHILNGMQIGMANSLQTLIIAEMLAANEGIGHLILNSRVSLSTELAYGGIFIVGVLGLLADSGFRKVTGILAGRYRLS